MSRFTSNNKKTDNISYLPFQECIAKTTSDNLPGLSVQKHSEYVGEVAECLIRRMPASCALLFPEGTASMATLHDVGKVSPGFQKKISSEPTSGFDTNHATISEASFKSWLEEKVVRNSDIEQWGFVLGSHHGKREAPMSDNVNIYGGPEWQQERYKLITILVNKFGKLPSNPPLSKEQRNIVSGLVSVADWIASDEDYFPPEGLPRETDIKSHVDNVLDHCGWIYPKFNIGLKFEDIFEGKKPYAVQKDFVDSVTGPGLYILEAPMGMGKTEAALYGAYKLISNGQNNGLYFGLPTRLTSNKIYERVQGFLNKVICGRSECRLIHGQAWLKLGGGEEFRSGCSWFNPLKRAILAPFGVGTIDQALLSVLRVKHFFVRTFGLAGKVVILDEVHSYDVYTGVLLDVLIESLLEMECSVFILSATLTAGRRESFFKDKIPLRNDYPLITSQPKSGMIKFYMPKGAEFKKVQVRITGNDVMSTAKVAVKKAQEGQCVLWIANTVSESQKYYKAVMSEKRDVDTFRVGLLHSRFPAYRREELEDEWMEFLGKDGNRADGCVLVSTQIVEQSVDIDADFMISDLAPTDMLLQRLGRLWRHKREGRPCKNPEFLICCGNIENANNKESLEDAMGKSRYVYAPYVLWRSYEVWKRQTEVLLPHDIRGLLESTYQPLENEPDFILELKEKLDRERKKMKDAALGSTAEAMPEMPDDEQIATRYSTQFQIQALLVKNLEPKGKSADLTLMSGEDIHVYESVRNFDITKRLHRNIVPLNRNRFRKFDNLRAPKYLSKHIYGELLVLLMKDDGQLFYNGDKPTSLFYDNLKGIYQMESSGLYTEHFKEEDSNEFDW
ncbi:MAG: CRISPR-associated helicase Cas3' [Candidatus Scalindua sp.]